MNLEIYDIADLRAIIALDKKLSQRTQQSAQELLIFHKDADKDDWINIIKYKSTENTKRIQVFKKLCRKYSGQELSFILKRLIAELEGNIEASEILKKAKEYKEYFERPDNNQNQ